MAFTISSSTNHLINALPNQYLDLFNATDLAGNFSTTRTFAVEFDTVPDFELGGNENHIGIDIHSLRSNGSVAAAYYPDDGDGSTRISSVD
ncbi:unnamed protein product [Linum tenue]|uniref:Legume lectin domain-containing protein n=1 Tax=Linum tenue TaxID=586396 RepID=A0AAV0MBV0_9ROSI|nr:unnamed protein product [Linum tenue]